MLEGTPVWSDWVAAIAAGLAAVTDETLRRAAEVILASQVVICAGNGGSAALAAHAAQTVAKPDYAPGGGRAAVALTDNVSSLSAHANDGGWNDAFAECARPWFDMVPRCALLAISSSGRSPNITRLALLARDRGLPVIGFTGFDGGALRELSTISLHVASDDYEVVEPAHDALLHRCQFHLRALSRLR